MVTTAYTNTVVTIAPTAKEKNHFQQTIRTRAKMTKLTKWEVNVEYGPTAADVHYVTVDAENMTDALAKGMKWAVDNKILSPLVCNASELTGDDDLADDDYTDLIEWTEEEEEEFVRMLKGDI